MIGGVRRFLATEYLHFIPIIVCAVTLTLAVIENNKLVDTVTIKSDGVGGFFSIDGERTFMGALTSNVIADTERDLDVYGANTIVWAK